MENRLKDEEFCQLFGNLRVSDGKLKWTGSLDELKSFLESSFKLDGKWTSPSPAISSINVTNMNTLPIKSTLCISNKIEYLKQLDECPASSDENLDKDTNVPLVLTNKVVAASVQTESPTLVAIFPEPGEHKGPFLTKRNYSTTNLPKHMVFSPFVRTKGFCLKGSNCDFSHNDLNQNKATNQPLSNENQ